MVKESIKNSLFYFIAHDGAVHFRVIKGASFEDNQKYGFQELANGSEPDSASLDSIIERFNIQFIDRIPN